MNLRRFVLKLGVLLILVPPLGSLAVMMCQPIGSAPGLLLGMLFLPAIGVSLLGCIAFIAAARRRGRALLALPTVCIGYVGVLFAANSLWGWKEERFLREYVGDLRQIAGRVIRKESTLAEERLAMEQRGWELRVDVVGANPPDAIVFVLAGALNAYHGIAFSKTGRRPTELSCCGMIRVWEWVASEDYYWWLTG